MYAMNIKIFNNYLFLSKINKNSRQQWGRCGVRGKMCLTELRNMLGKTQSRRILSSPRATDRPRQVHPLQLTLKTKTGRKDLPHLVTERRPQRKGYDGQRHSREPNPWMTTQNLEGHHKQRSGDLIHTGHPHPGGLQWEDESP